MNKKIICIGTFVCMLIMLSAPASSEYGGPGGSGGSTGGSGIVTCEASDNIMKVEKHDVNIRKDVTSIHPFQDVNMYQAYINGIEDESNVALRIEYLKGMSTCVNKHAPGKIYQYVNIWIGSQNIKNATFKFKIESSSIENNRNVDIFEWNKNNKEWVKLRSVIVLKLDKYAYFEFNVESFGPFAIGMPGQGTVGTIPTATIGTTVTAAPITTPISTTGIPNTGHIEETPIPLKPRVPGFGAVVMIGILLYAAYIRKRR